MPMHAPGSRLCSRPALESRESLLGASEDSLHLRSYHLCPCDRDGHDLAMPLAPGSAEGMRWRAMSPC